MEREMEVSSEAGRKRREVGLPRQSGLRNQQFFLAVQGVVHGYGRLGAWRGRGETTTSKPWTKKHGRRPS